MTSAVDALKKQSGQTTIEKERAAEGVDLNDFLLDVAGSKGLDINVSESIIDGSIERTMDGASTLSVTVHDPSREMLRSGMFDHAIDVKLDGQWFRLAQVNKQGDDLELTFEDRVVAYLRIHKKPRSMSRSKVTRAQFVRLLVREVKATTIPFISPSIGVTQKQAAAEAAKKKTPDERAQDRGRGINVDASLTIDGQKATRAQIEELNTMLDVANRLKAGPKATKAMVCAAIGESHVGRDPDTFTGNSLGFWGVFQGSSGKVPPWAPNFPDPHDTEAQATAFLKGGKGFQAGGAIALAKAEKTITVGDIATRVEASGEPGSYYGQYADDAQAIIEEYGGNFTGGGSITTSYSKSYQFHRGQPDGPKGENTWDCAGRLADDVRWRRFVSGGKFYFISDEDLMKSASIKTISEDEDYIDFIDFDVDSGKDINEAYVTGRADRWFAPPGSTVVVEKSGPADGKWLVWSIERGLFSSGVKITLRQPESTKKEPAHETVEVSSNADETTSRSDLVKVAPGANRSGVSLKKPLMDFLAEVAKHTNEEIKVTTGTNHDKYTKSGNVSDHWTGHGADLADIGGDARTSTAASSKGDNIAIAALVACGVPRNDATGWARSGQLDFGIPSIHEWKGHRVQIGWKTLVGGNHYNHVHIGVR